MRIGWNAPGWIVVATRFSPDIAAVEMLREALAKIAHEAAGISI